MLKIRLRRMGSKRSPFYRIVVSDSRSTPQGAFVDVVGTYDPRVSPAVVKLDVEKADSWVSKGAQASNTVRSLMKQARSTDTESATA